MLVNIIQFLVLFLLLLLLLLLFIVPFQPLLNEWTFLLCVCGHLLGFAVLNSASKRLIIEQEKKYV